MPNTNMPNYANLVATPVVLAPVSAYGGRVRAIVDTVTVADGDFDADGDSIKLCRIPTNARLIGMFIGNEDLDGGAQSAVNVGFYNTDGTIKDEDAILTASTSFRSANFTWNNNNLLEDEAAAKSGNIGKRVWELAGDTSDPGGEYDLVMTQTAAVADDQGGGLVTFVLLYMID